jgi:hypothetical protein
MTRHTEFQKRPLRPFAQSLPRTASSLQSPGASPSFLVWTSTFSLPGHPVRKRSSEVIRRSHWRTLGDLTAAYAGARGVLGAAHKIGLQSPQSSLISVRTLISVSLCVCLHLSIPHVHTPRHTLAPPAKSTPTSPLTAFVLSLVLGLRFEPWLLQP